jgi:Glycosyl transferase family 11
MIRVVLQGRTGNNLFQYAIGRALAEHHGVPLILDGSGFNRRSWASVSCLGRLPLKARIERPFSIGSRVLKKLAGKHHWEFRGVTVLREVSGDQRFDARFLDAPADCMLMGYFQTPRYFGGIEDLLRQELRMDHVPWPDETRRMADRLRDERKVAVHVRRTDYIGNADVEVCGKDYYRRAMERLRSRQEGLRFFLFSDDPAWCRENLASDDAEVCTLDGARGDALHDLYLMSQAGHQIIANSSYSWWGAWLGKKPGQQVLVPAVWYRSGIVAPVEEKLCEGWETVKLRGDEEPARD